MDDYTLDQAQAWAKAHGYQLIAVDHLSASAISVRVPVKTVSELEMNRAHGQAGPGLGRSHVDPRLDIPAGSSSGVKSMPIAKVDDPKSNLVNQLPKLDDIHTLESEEKDLSGITYGKQAPIPTLKPIYGQQRMVTSAYSDHTEIEQSTTKPALGIAIAQGSVGTQDQLTIDGTLTQVPATNIKQDVKGELMQKRDEPVYNEDNDDDDEDGEWVEAFRAGIHTDAEGATRKWDPTDIVNIAQQYNRNSDPANSERHIAPVVLGHPKDNEPAVGWVQRAKAVGDKLMLKLGELHPAFVDALKKGMYKTRSISLYPDLNIRHLGFLGAAVPAVKGLGPFKFAEDKPFNLYEFGENMEDVNELKTENKFFKRLFDLFKIDTTRAKEYAEREPAIQDTTVPTVETIDKKFPEGATMAEEKVEEKKLTVADHMAHCNMAMAEAQGALASDPAKAAEHMTKLCEHLAALDTAIKSGNYAEVSADVVGTAGTKEIPVSEVKNDKDEITKLAEEISALRAEISTLKGENERLLSVVAAEQKENAMGEYKEFVNGLVASGQIRPVEVEQTIINLKLRADLDKQEATDFSEQKITQVNNNLETYKAYISSMPKVVEFAEICTGKAPTAPTGTDYVEGKIKEFMDKEPGLQYHVALNKLAETEPDKVQAYLSSNMTPVSR